MKCSCCEHEFNDEESKLSCEGCVTHGSCGLVKCPHCGFEMAREPAILSRIKAFFRKNPGAVTTPAPAAHNGNGTATVAAGFTSLKDLGVGDTASIEAFTDSTKMRKFTSMGILPGTHVTVVRRSPAIVLRVGYSEFAFDYSLASSVRVNRI